MNSQREIVCLLGECGQGCLGIGVGFIGLALFQQFRRNIAVQTHVAPICMSPIHDVVTIRVKKGHAADVQIDADIFGIEVSEYETGFMNI